MYDTASCVISLKYQLYWVRVFSVLPCLFFLSWLEYKLFGHFIHSSVFIAISICITFLFAFTVFPFLGKVFVKNGAIKIDGDMIHFFKGGNNVLSCNIRELDGVEIDQINLYGTSFDKMLITGNKIRLVYYSADKVEQPETIINDAGDNVYTFNQVAAILNDIIKNHK